MKKSLFLIEDEPLLCDLFGEYVEELEEIEYLGFASDGKLALEKILELKPDIVILDIRLPEINGLEILTIIGSKAPDTKAIIFTGSLSEETLRVATSHGAIGYIEKAYGLDELSKAIRSAAKGERYYSPGVQKLLQHFRYER